MRSRGIPHCFNQHQSVNVIYGVVAVVCAILPRFQISAFALSRFRGYRRLQEKSRIIPTRTSRRVLPVLAASAILALTACDRLAPRTAQGSGTENTTPTTTTVQVRRGNFRRTLRLAGTVASVESYPVMAPMLGGQMASTMVITKLISNGARVRPGDVVVEFDRQKQQQSVLDREAEYQGLLEQIKRKQADQAAAVATDETELKSAEYDLQAARVDMRKNEVVSSIEAEKNVQNLAEAEARLKQLNETFALKREAAAAELRILEIQRDRAQAAMIHAQNNIEKMSVKSPQGGLAVLTPVFKMSRFGVSKEGDEVRPGSPILLVVNPAAMEVRARANQVDVYQIQQGQPAEVRLDAYPELVLPGKIGRIGAIAAASQYSQQVRHFAAVISIVGSDPKLLPDLSASADVQLETLENVLLLPREAVVFPQGQPMVEVILDGRSELRPVKLGPMNDCEVVIASGLDEGTAVSRYPRLPERGAQASAGEKKQ